MDRTQSSCESQTKLEPVAIIGIGCRFPGGADSPSAFWELLVDGRDAIVEVPSDRWNVRRFYDPNPAKPGKMYIRAGGFLREPIDRFDALFFGVSPREAMCLDPQQRILLEVAWEALEDAGIPPESVAGSGTGVFVGGFTLDNMLMQMGAESRGSIGPHTAVGSTMTILSNRLSYFFDFRGPSVSIDTACSSSLVGFHYACQSLWKGECTLALAGGVNIILRPEYPIAMCKGQFLAPDGHCKSFDARADGYGRGEGAGIVVLKPLAAALRDGDRIYALVRGTGVNQDGRTQGITVPNPASQEALVRSVCERAQVSPGQIRYVEAHGTGTAVGDPLEANALGAALGAGRSPEQACVVGSLKANVGHLEAAAGIAGVIKASLCLDRDQIPPLANLETPNPKIHFEELGLRLPRQLEPMPGGKGPALVGVNSFGYGGTNAHAILEEPPSTEPRKVRQESEEERRPYLLPVSARSEQALTDLARAYLDVLAGPGAPSLTDFCYSASLRRDHHDHRLTVTARSREDMAEQLRSFVDHGKGEHVSVGRVLDGQASKPVFVFTGMGPQWWGMGRELFESEPVYRKVVEDCDGVFRRVAGWSILAEMSTEEAHSRMNETQVAQPANFVLQAGLAALWRSWGVEPAAIVGHSMGEVTAAYSAGVLDLEDAVRVSFHRSRIQKKAAGQGKMLAVGLGEDDARVVLEKCEGRVSIAAANSATAVTLAGDADALEDVAIWLTVKGVFNRFLQVEVPYHSHYMEPLKDELRGSLRGLRTSEPDTPLYSTVTGQIVEGKAYDAEYWCRNIREPVLFAKAMEHLIEDGHRVFLEVGPHPVLSTSIKEGLLRRGASGNVLASLRRKQPEMITLLDAFGGLHTSGYAVEWERLYPRGGCYVRIPTYPWQRESYWHETDDARLDRLGTPEHLLLGIRQLGPTPAWESTLSEGFLPYLKDHCVEGLVVLPGAAYVEAGLAVCGEVAEQDGCTLENIEFHKAMVVDDTDEPILRTTYDGERRRYAIYSRPHDEKYNWTLHTTGALSLLEAGKADSVALDEIRTRCREVVDAETLYRQLDGRGLQYGPHFRAIRHLWRQPGEVLAQIEGSPAETGWEDRYYLHPTLLDACFQSLIAALDSGDGDDDTNVYVPVRIRQIRFRSGPAGGFWSHGRLTRRADGFIEGDITLCDDEGDVLAEVRGIRCQALGTRNKSETIHMDRWTYAFAWQKAELEAEAGLPGRWLLFVDQKGVGDRLVAQLRASGANEVIRVLPGDAFERDGPHGFRMRGDSRTDMHSLLEEADAGNCRGVVFLWGLDASSDGEDPVGMGAAVTCLHLLQGLDQVGVEGGPRLFIVTRGVQQVLEDEVEVALPQSPLVGLGRVAFNECPGLRCTLVDLDSVDDVDSVPVMAQELLGDSSEDDVAVRRGERYVHRLLRDPMESAEPLEEEPISALPGHPFVLETGTPGVIDSLRFRESETKEPGPGEVEIAVHAAALGSTHGPNRSGRASGQDAQIASGGAGLALEVAGVVTRVGDGVGDLREGDSLVALVPGRLSSHVTVPAGAVVPMPKPEHVDFAEAAGLPIPFVTAYFGLHQLARLQAGEAVLIHACAGGVGVAAVQVARWIGAEVFVTAPGQEQGAALDLPGVRQVLDSRSLDFADQVVALTGGRGVDVVLDCVGGEVGDKSQDVLAPFGRFIDVSGHDGSQRRRSWAVSGDSNCTFATVSIERIVTDHPALFRRLLREVWERFQTRELTPPPVTQFPATQVVEAFRRASRAEHTDKTVISLRDNNAVPVLPKVADEPLFDPGGTYLISGGFGGFGLEVARWIVGQGARYLVLVGRRGAATPGAEQAIQELEQAGARVLPVAADITQEDQVKGLLTEVAGAMPPLKGVVHAAAVLDDGPLVELDSERFAKVMAPKALGAWHLHRHTLDESLDFFVLFSSVSSLIGNARQGNYVAANTFVDTLAHFRRARGLAATSINWGVLTGAGMAASSEDVAKHLELMGIHAFTAGQAMEALAQVLRWDPVQIGVMDVDWRRWGQFEPTGGGSPRFAHLVAKDGNGGENSAANELRQSLLEMPLEERVEMLGFLLAELVAETLRLPVERVPLDQPVTNMGIDSLMVVELQTGVSVKFGVELSTLELMKGNTIAQMGKQLMVKMGLGGDGSPMEEARAEPEPENVLEQVDTLSDEDVDNLLGELLAQTEA